MALLAGVLVASAFSAVAHPRIAPGEMRCMAWAARHYHRPSDPISLQAFVDLLAAIRLTEGGQVGHIHWNRNGSYDIGPMQINSTHLAQLRQFGISYQSLLQNDCENIVVGAWILHSNLGAARNLWASIGDYNSHTPWFNRTYQLRIWRHLQTVWADKMTRGVLHQSGQAAVAVAAQ